MIAYDSVLAPIVTEKSINGQQSGKYTFRVRNGTNKIEIANTIAKIYGVEVKDVNIIKLPPKKRIIGRGRTINKRSPQVKAVVTLKKGQTIDFAKIKDLK